ncbi:hypothetical protein [Sediminibacter sp. Hel_I_10]|uniref:hypothetical protein n=1 Tax=Sediminibacter sp. Hel_I_10 TaxID=1392490 RepID=UPI000479F3EB|nr:hypothetical protein [Sediminibacter sp. Hel_I_10]
MKRILKLLLAFVLLFIGLVYWSVSGVDETFGQCQLYEPKTAEGVDFKTYDSVLVAASTIYDASLVKRFMQGNNYRDAWATPTVVPVLYLDTLYGGVTIVKEGGGHQTHSLKLEDSIGTEYTLRSINKDPTPLIPEIARTLKLENVIVDGISAQHPYGAILTAALADAVDVLHTRPKVVFLPKQPGLTTYNDAFGDRLFLLEYEPKGPNNWTDLDNVFDIADTDNLQEHKQELGAALTVDKRAVIRARLFDFLIGDWDRHAKQWGWVVQDLGDRKIARPIAADRDNAFFSNDGVLPKILSSRYLVPRLRPYDEDIDFMEGLVYPFDRYFLIDTDMALFTSEAKALQQLLTDEVIANAFKVWPDQITKLDAEAITKKLKQRREDLVDYAKAYKEEIDRQGLVHEPLKGSEDKGFPEALTRCFECGDQ